MLRKIIIFFDKLEDRVRGALSVYPLVYALVAGIAIVLFWRGVWETADLLQLSGPLSLLIGLILLLVTGVFVSAFIGSRLIISGLRGEKKTEEKEIAEILAEESMLEKIYKEEQKIEKEIKELEGVKK